MATDILECCREEDFVEYFLFIEGIDDDVNANDEAKLIWESKLLCIRSSISKYTDGYIWHKDGFNVNLRDKSQINLLSDSESMDKDAPPHLYGITHYGDNIEDEWFIVFMLLELTKEVEGLVVRVVDSDGQFLLIESADVLPKWATPETCDNRVFLYNGTLHLIPPTIQVASIREAVIGIRQDPSLSQAEEGIQSAVLNRIEGYPDKARRLLHRTTASVPIAVAALLRARPQLVAPAVLAFCNRDPIDMKACRAMRWFPPEVCVNTSVVMTQCLYAMLLHHKYTPDRRTGWTLPPSVSQKQHSLGVKLACGFEILVTDAKQSNEEKGWLRYVESLKKRGYFMDLLEGSKEYTTLLDKAQDYYQTNKATILEKPAVGQAIIDLMTTLDYDVQQMKKDEASLPNADDESWLELDPKDMDAMLEQRYGRNVNQDTDIASRLTHFLEHVSGVDGAEFPPEEPPTRPKRGVKKEAKKKQETDPTTDMTKSIAFDSEAFSCAVQNILDLVVPEDHWSSDDSDMSSYEDEADLDLDNLKVKPESDNELKQYMDQMDRELSKTTLSQSFQHRTDNFDDVEDFQPVDVDLNAVNNVLESYKAQVGGAGPASNLLGPMGVRLEPQPAKYDGDSS